MTQPADLHAGPLHPAGDGIHGDIAVYGGISIREIAGQEGTDSVGSATASRTWLCKGSSNPIVCRTALLDGPIPINVYDGLFINNLTRERVANKAWEFTANYDSATPDVGGYTVSIDTTGAQILQTSAYAQQRFPATDQTAPDFGNSIDVQEGKPQGVQRIIPALKINIRAKIATTHVSSPLAYAKLLAELTGTVNQSAAFGGEFAPGELLFAGASGEVVAKDPQLTFTFIASKNVNGLTIGDITGINKKGHEFMWFLHEPGKDATTKTLVTKPLAAYVGQIYGLADHGRMKIGVAA